MQASIGTVNIRRYGSRNVSCISHIGDPDSQELDGSVTVGWPKRAGEQPKRSSEHRPGSKPSTCRQCSQVGWRNESTAAARRTDTLEEFGRFLLLEDDSGESSLNLGFNQLILLH